MTASPKNTASEPVTDGTKKAAFATPDRDHHHNVVAPSSASSIQNEATPAGGEMQTVTPPTPNGKQVRFDKDNVNGVVSSKRGVVSRRGGRYGSPSRTSVPNMMAAPAVPVEYSKTYRSPKREETSSDGGVPSLCSSHSEALGEAPSMISCSEAETTSPLTEMSPSKKPKPESRESRNVTFSPRPTEVSSAEKMSKKTPTRSPTNHHFHNLPSLRDAKLSSPCGIFLSPCPPSPSAYATIAGPPRTGFEEEKSSKAKSEERERALATPTDFAVDFGKGHQSSASFDGSNVLAWLNSPQSPTAHGLFSPGGGLGSALNTPRTSRTPTHTSFFFSDVASLPHNGEFISPKNKRPGMISISPLAPKRKFIQPRTMPMLGESPKMDAVQMAEQELLEDEDLSVLLQLASRSNTPRSKDGSDVFRSPRGRKGGYDRDSSDPALQLPIIGHNDGLSGTNKLSRKLSSRDDRSADDFAPPPLGIRSSSSGASREVFTRENGNEKHPLKPSTKDSVKENDSSEAQIRKKSSKSKKNRKGGPHAGYMMPPYPPRSDGPYYPMPAMPPGGSMRVVVGGPPPMNSRSGSKNSANSPPRHNGNSTGSPSRHPHYPMPPDGYGPGSMYPPPPHYHHPPPHMGVPYGHYPHPPPRHMASMYPSSHPSSKNSTKGNNSKKAKGSKTSKAPVPAPKRPLQVVSDPSIEEKGSPSKKARKASPKAAAAAAAAAAGATMTPAPVKKKKSPTAAAIVSADPVDRQKAAATIAAVNAASGGMNDKAAALAAAILRGVTMRPSGKWQAQLYYAGKSRYIGVFDTREKAALAYEIAREKLKSDNKTPADQSAQTLKATENAVNAARKAAFDGVNEKDPRVTGK